MRESHANKSISFLMELIFVLFFFTLASAVCVLVLGTAKDKIIWLQIRGMRCNMEKIWWHSERFPRYSRQCRRKSFTWMRTETGHLRRQDIIGLKLNRRKRLKKVVGHFVSFVFTAMTKSLYVFPFCWKGAFKNEA